MKASKQAARTELVHLSSSSYTVTASKNEDEKRVVDETTKKNGQQFGRKTAWFDIKSKTKNDSQPFNAKQVKLEL
ncbi:unnamed protein product [Toxocara canis]|uniref:Lipoprotein n=1 Tax=Toxocara canis TaxID=6265 RepID=A0A183V0F9_TOXCA|nr:unnamed protein product [Toxocara canis]